MLANHPLSRHLGRAKEILHASLPPAPSAQYFGQPAPSREYAPLLEEPSDNERTRRELESYERIPGFSIPSRQDGIRYPYYPDWKEPESSPSYQRQQFNDLIDPASPFPLM